MPLCHTLILDSTCCRWLYLSICGLSFLLKAVQYSVVQINHNSFNEALFDGHTGCRNCRTLLL
jgi:hypothetical protein